MKENSVKGTVTELHCQLDFIEAGFLVSQPIIPDSKYDYIVDINNKLYRIQCKSATLSSDGTHIVIRTKTTNVRTMKDSYYSKDDIDFFYTFYNGISYLLPVEKAAHGETSLRFVTQANNPRTRMAKDYEFNKIILTLQEEVDS
jgi:hypothetical protein